ncbi:unnamed protein product [Cuscuta campestris]|nr:unnamed protein product [Cuscuta campestris]
MEGVGIARKIDLNAHSSYASLTSSVITLFGRDEEDVEAYALTYQDKEGDWLLAGDVPWGTFIQSVQRLKLVKREDLS